MRAPSAGVAYAELTHRNAGFLSDRDQARLARTGLLVLGAGGMGGAALQSLVRAKVLRSHKGYGGGFVLVADPEDLNLEQVIELIDGPFTVFECLADKGFCKLCSSCKLQRKFRQLQETMLELLRETNLKELVRPRPKKDRRKAATASEPATEE